VTELKQIYKCSICGNVIEVVHTGKGQLVCCNKPMEVLVENTVDASREKHVPVVDKKGEVITVTVGSTPHPMEEKHYIEWIELITDNGVYRQFLKPGQQPQGEFYNKEGFVTARGYCNLHGLWKS